MSRKKIIKKIAKIEAELLAIVEHLRDEGKLQNDDAERKCKIIKIK